MDRTLKFTEPNTAEPTAGWVRTLYRPAALNRWVFFYRTAVFADPSIIAALPHRVDTVLALVRQFPHYMNDIVEIPIWP